MVTLDHGPPAVCAEPMRVVILGNAGSGKSSLARWLAERHRLEVLDLDTVAWEPGQTAVPRDPGIARGELERFCTERQRWVVEGCYGGLVRVALAFRPWLIWLDPGLERCLEHCRARPWEPHKYASPAEQNERLPFLLEWVAGYDEREGELGRADHQACFLSYDGRRTHLRSVHRRDVLAPELWV